MLCKCHWIVLYTVHFTAFCLGGPFLSGHGVYKLCSRKHDRSLTVKFVQLQKVNFLTCCINNIY